MKNYFIICIFTSISNYFSMSTIKQHTKHTFEQICTTYFGPSQTWKLEEDAIDILVALINTIRPKKPKEIEELSIEDTIQFLKENVIVRRNFTLYLQTILADKNFESILTDAGILHQNDFFYEVKKRIFAKILPYQAQKDALQYVLNQIFHHDSDPIWIYKIPKTQLEQLFDLLSFTSIYASTAENKPLYEVLQALNLLSQRCTGKALEQDVIKMVPEYNKLESPFEAFEAALAIIQNEIRAEQQPNFTSIDNQHYKQLQVLFKQCIDFVEKAFQNSSKYGISLNVNQSLLRIKQQLYRIEILMPFLVVNKPSEEKEKSIELALKLIKYNCQKTNVRKLINESTQLLSYEITQHTAKTGEKYITESKTEYFRMLYASLGGGFVVGILCIIKLLFSKIETSHFGHAFLYSFNYSFGFIIIFLLGFTLATKQPAMTAAALITALEEGLKTQGISAADKHKTFAKLFARLFRSQFIAFVGNVVMAFPVSLLGIWLIDTVFSTNIASEKWTKLITDLNPITSLSILHAAIAGIFLFLSGIISGSIANRDKHYEVKYRIQEHPWLKMTFGKVKTRKIAAWHEKNWPGIVSNFWFGIFLGSTASLGLFLGLNLDIRHITFASGNLALALYGATFNVDNSLLFWGIFGIGIIGLVNFLVSFGLSLGLAFRSRNIAVTELRPIFSSIKKQFITHPFSFFFPTK